MRFLKVPFMRCQALMRRRERKGRRKWELPESSYLGHMVKNRMTVISRWSAIIIPADAFGLSISSVYQCIRIVEEFAHGI